MPKNNEMEITVNNSNLDFTSAHETGKRKSVSALSEELKAQFIAYFMQRYPCTKKITIKRKHGRYRARVKYRGESPNRTFWVQASSYEMLVMKTEMNYSYFRGLPPATNR